MVVQIQVPVTMIPMQILMMDLVIMRKDHAIAVEIQQEIIVTVTITIITAVVVMSLVRQLGIMMVKEMV